MFGFAGVEAPSAVFRGIPKEGVEDRTLADVIFSLVFCLFLQMVLLLFSF
jgi:hypothetical protein